MPHDRSEAARLVDQHANEAHRIHRLDAGRDDDIGRRGLPVGHELVQVHLTVDDLNGATQLRRPEAA